jgi:carboxymethylenebutenolidase
MEDEMPTTALTIETPDGECTATLHTPAPQGRWPAVIMFMDAGGIRPTFHDMAQHLAGLGYSVLLPDLYYRHGPFEPFDMASVFTDAGERSRLMEVAACTSKEKATSDTAAFLDVLSARPEVAGEKVGTTGYCMGGGHSLTAAGRFPARIAAAASFHGGSLATDAPDSPHLLAQHIAGRVYVASARDDPSSSPEQMALLRSSLSAAGVDATIETYPALHGFAVPDNPTYDSAAADRHWQALDALYSATLHD